MTTPEPTPDLIAVARRVAARTWTVPGGRSAFKDMDPNLRSLVDAGLARLVIGVHQFTDDYWALSIAGEGWLRDVEADAMWSHTSGPNP